MEKILDKMPIEVIIPAKFISMRIPDKNFRDFYQGQSLLEIKINQILKLFSPSKIHVFSNNPAARAVTQKYKINFHQKILAFWPEDIKMCCDTLSEKIILTCFVTTPFINAKLIACMVDEFLKKEIYDSLVTVTRIKSKLFKPDYKPLNFGYGDEFHLFPQYSPLFELQSGVSIVYKQIARDIGCHFGYNPLLFEISRDLIDINEPDDWNFAQRLLEISEYKDRLTE